MSIAPKLKLLVIIGPTASGKSDLAMNIAKKLNGEVISADSRQVYKGLNIGTGKITRKEMRGIRHHLLDVADPRRQFTVVQYVKLAERAIADIRKRGKLPIICGGTGFYIDALVNNVQFPAVIADKKLRARLSKRSAGQLLIMLKELDPKRAKSMNESDRQNPRRLIRAIEIALGGAGKTAKAGKSSMEKPEPKYDVELISLNIPQAELKKRIRARLLKRLKAGMIEEARRLHTKPPRGIGLSWKRMEELGLEYRYLAIYLQGKMTREDMIEKLNMEIWHYAKRQMTWFKRDERIKWCDPKSKIDVVL